MKSLLWISAIGLSLNLIGCASIPSHDQMKQEIKAYRLSHPDNPKMSTIYVVRPSSVGTLIRFNVFVNETDPASEVGWNRGNQHIFVQLPPGTYNILSKAENTASLAVKTLPGKTYFIRQDASMGIIMARNSLVQIDEVEGTYHVMKTGRGEFLNSPKYSQKRGAASTVEGLK